MARSFRWLALATVIPILSLAAGCGGDDGPVTIDPVPCDAADAWMQAIADSLEAIPNDPSSDYVQNLRYPEIRAGLDAVLADNPNCAVAHLGAALMDVLEINYDSELWALIDSLDNYSNESPTSPPPPPPPGGLYLRPGSPILGNQFTILATAPREFMRRATLSIPANVTVAKMQEILESTVIPALTSAIVHLQSAEAAGPALTMAVEDETYQIDMGDVRLFHAGLHAARAGFRMLTAYDYSVPGPDGTYGWIDDVRTLNDECRDFGRFDSIGVDSVRAVRTETNQGEAQAESVAVATLQYNLGRSGFLTQRNAGMSNAFDDVLAARDQLEAAVASIRAETDNQTDDVVRIVDLTDLDDEIAAPDPNRPAFAENFTTIEDVLTWVNEVLSGPYQVREMGDVDSLIFQVDLRGFFQNAPTDWKTKLPFHQFRTGDWTSVESDSSFYPPWSSDYWVYDCPAGTHIFSSNVTEVLEIRHRVKVEPLDLLLEDGVTVINDLSLHDDIPYLPDYTLGGLFPNANRAKWVEIKNAAGW